MTDLKRSDFSKICRTCLLEKDDMEPIYKSEIPKMLMSFTNIKVEYEDGLPNSFCSTCINKIQTCYEFKIQSEMNQEILKMCPAEEDELTVTPDIVIKDEIHDSETLTTNFGWDDISDSSDTEEETPISELKKRQQKIPKRVREESDSCEFCHKKFVDRYVLKRHIENMHTKTRQKETCDICKRDVMCMSLHMRRKHNGEFKYKCNLIDCQEKFFYKTHLIEHIRVEHNEESILAKKENILCTNCGKILHSRKAYGYHLLLHTGERPFQCSFCVKKYRSHNYLKIHERSHTGERPYPCTYCDRAFRDSGTLKGHIRIHTGEKPFVCSICERAFTQRIAMKTHMKIHLSLK